MRRIRKIIACQAFAMALAPVVSAGLHSSNEVLLVVNDKSAESSEIGHYYAQRRHVPEANVCHLQTTSDEVITRAIYDSQISSVIASCLRMRGLTDRIVYIVTTRGVPLRIEGSNGMNGDRASVDSELTLLYQDMKTGQKHPTSGAIPNPFYGRRDQEFSHPAFPIYLVTRLAAYDVAGAKGLVDRALVARNKGKFVIDLSDDNDAEGNNWLRDAAIFLPPDRVVFDAKKTPVYGENDVIAYAGWGSNDANRTRRFLGFRWLPGAIATEYVSSNGRTFARPPDNWTPSADWASLPHLFSGSAQSLAADYILEGATGASAHVVEPFLFYTPHPDLLLPAYYKGRNLAESYWLSIPALSWQNVVIGDPLCSLGPPGIN